MAELNLADGEVWQHIIPDTEVIEHDGKEIRLRDHPFIAEAKDPTSFAKRAFDQHKRMGNSVVIPTADDKPETIEAFRSKVRESGHIPSAPGSVDGYEFTPPEKMPNGLVWNDELVNSYKEHSLKSGLTKEQAAANVDFFNTIMGGYVEGMIRADGDFKEGLKELWGDKHDDNMALADRGALAFVKDKAELEAVHKFAGLFLKKEEMVNVFDFFQRVGKAGEEDQSLLPEMVAGDGEADYKEALDIMSNPDNPKHKERLAQQGRPEAEQIIQKFIDAAFKKKYPGSGEEQLGAEWVNKAQA